MIVGRQIPMLLVLYCTLFALTGCSRRPMAPVRLTGIWHPVSTGDSVHSVAGRYGADAEVLAELNDLPADGSLSGREEIFVPKQTQGRPGSGVSPTEAARRVGSQHETDTAPEKAVEKKKSTDRPIVARADKRRKCGPGGRPCLAWPVDGEVVSKFGDQSKGHHDGIDITAPSGTAVRAAADGRVIYSGDAIQGYGNLVIVQHRGGILTVYAHNQKNLVKEGDQVKRGRIIARVGRTGAAKKDHLHFEVRVTEHPQDPLLYLSSKR